MRDLNNTFIAEKNAETNKPTYLYTIEDYDGIGTDLHLTNMKDDVIFNGVTYTSFPIRHDAIEETTDGKINAVEISVGNASRLIQAYLNQYDFRDKKVIITLVFRDVLGDPTTKTEDIYYINNWRASALSVFFVCTSRLDVLGQKIPARKYSRIQCQFRFKDTNTCQYVGPETACNKTKQQCRAYNNLINFGTQKVPTRNIYAV